ncbi:hypothetical protein IV203_020146 [Nitzschia inconspicua]|uniref:Uncharacterized protein n=1 Tax=Nitzschia inconspicua TaxID=303405 RepID=A0A9K3KA64_9STRA|nr:hypothetical protein IV203_020336 [Nitzschia inconspicua]KAG7371576.1 hypothetical protein IV203_020146 [Nitzschia inconspicua]
MQRPTKNPTPSLRASQDQEIALTIDWELPSSPSYLPTTGFSTDRQRENLDMAGKMQRQRTGQPPVASYLSSRSASFSPSLSLRFNPVVLVRFVPSLDDITPQEQSDLWYSSADYKNIRRREQTLMKQVLQRTKTEHSQQCYVASRPSMSQSALGLQTSQERKNRFQNIRKTQLLVLEEQKRLLNADPDQLARIYSERSKECTQQARERGVDVEIVLRSLELASLEQNKCNNHLHDEMGRYSACWESPWNLSPDMKHQRWSAELSPSSSHSSSPTRGGSSCNDTVMLDIERIIPRL